MAEELQNPTDVPHISTAPDTTFQAVVVFAGASQETAALYRAPLTAEHKNRLYYLDGGTNTVLTEDLMRYTVLAADNPIMTTLEIPENATLGLDYSDASVEYKFYVRNYGAGGLAVNASGAATITNYYDLDLSTEGPYHAVYTYTSREEDVWAVT
jgi:hypothetical protein